jgi:hypothetical protein
MLTKKPRRCGLGLLSAFALFVLEFERIVCGCARVFAGVMYGAKRGIHLRTDTVVFRRSTGRACHGICGMRGGG